MNRQEQPLEGQDVWYAADLASSDDWIYRLVREDVAEISQALEVARATGRTWPEIYRADFPLPRLGPRLLEVGRGLEFGRGVALLKGLPIEIYGDEELELLFWGIGTWLGRAEPQDASGALMHHIRDTGQDVASTDNVRGYQTASALPFHNDGGDIFALLCLEVAKQGGRSKLISAGAVFNEILARRPDLVATLQEPYDFDARAQELDGTARVQHVPIFNFAKGRIAVLYKRGYIHLAQRFDEVPPMSEAQYEALDLFDEICWDPAMAYEFDLEPGDIELANNFSVLHSRTRYDDESAEKRRHLLRLWMTTDTGRALPEVFRTTREFGLTYERRMEALQAAD